MIEGWQRAARLAAVMGLSAAVAACGGGGSSPPPPPPPPAAPFVVTIEESSVDVAFTEGTVPATQLLHVHTQGDIPAGGAYLGATSDSAAVIGIDYTFSGADASVILSIDPSLVPGDYTGHVTVDVCSDTACQHPIGGTPLVVPLSIHVAHAFHVTSGPTARVEAVSGQTATTSITVQLPDGVDSYTVDTGSNTPWVTLGAQSATGFDLQFASIPAGEYGAEVTLHAGDSTQVVSIDYVVDTPPGGQHGIVVGSASLATGEGQSASADLPVSPPTWGSAVQASLQYQDNQPTGWLAIAPSADGWQLQADASSLAAGTYTATLTFTGDSYTAPQTYPVNFQVGASLFAPANQVLPVDAQTAPGSLTLALPIPLIGTTPVPWTASTETPWLTIDTPSGVTGGTLRIHVSDAAEATLANATSQVATILLSPAHAGQTTPYFYVTVDKHLPEVHFVGPSALVAGDAHTLRVRGSGFATTSDLASRVTVSGTTGFTVTPVNDTEFTVSLPARGTGTSKVSVSNALGDTTSTATVRWVAPTSFDYAFIPQWGTKGGLTWDPVRQTLFSVNSDQAVLLAWQWSGTAWVQSMQSFPGAVSVGESPDRAELVVGGSDGTLHRVSPDTLAETSSVVVPGGSIYFWPNNDQGIPITNDGRVWYAGGNQFSYGWYDLRTGAFGDSGIAPGSLYGPYAIVSRDGERVALTPSAGSPSTGLYMDARDGVFHRNAGGQQVFWHGSLGDYGDRLLDDWNATVYDASYGTVGTVPFYGRAFALSPAGDRAYVLQYPEDGSAPWVDVYDSSQAPASGPSLPFLGAITVADYTSCSYPESSAECGAYANMMVSADGRTLFIIGLKGVVVQPIPVGMRGTASLAQARAHAAETLRAQSRRAPPKAMAAPSPAAAARFAPPAR
jgi:hypothetical protein